MSTERRPSAVFARAVRELREARPKGSRSQEWLARRLMEVQGVEGESQLGSYRVMVSRTESGKRTPTLDDLFLFARALEVGPADLLIGAAVEDLETRMTRLRESFTELERDLVSRLEDLERIRKLETEEEEE